ncbi:hypothetical protein LPN04_29450 [Rugamonas sp. A1-17]|nr:hypothetical protein [Rugamonas sp. A1-17]
MENATNSQTSFQWMNMAGVDASDLEWLTRLEGSIELHSPQNSARVERIYTAAAAGLLSRVSVVADIVNRLN